MRSLESFSPPHLTLAETSLKTPLITPEGYNVSTVEGAEAYLIEVHGRELPEIRTWQDVMEALKEEPRAAMYKDGTPENVYEHTMLLGTLCAAGLAERPDLKKDLTDRMWESHDGHEAPGMDTAIGDVKAMASKFWREEAGWTILNHYLPGDPHLHALALYREGKVPEAKYVHGMDKVAAYAFQLREDVQATLHRERQEEYLPLVENALAKVVDDPSARQLMKQVLIQLGEKWMPWGCKPFPGDPETIVEFYDQQAALKYTAQLQAERLPLGDEAEVRQFIGSTSLESLRPQPVLKDVKSAEERGVILLDSYRNSTPPTRPPFTNVVSLAEVA